MTSMKIEVYDEHDGASWRLYKTSPVSTAVASVLAGGRVHCDEHDDAWRLAWDQANEVRQSIDHQQPERTR